MFPKILAVTVAILCSAVVVFHFIVVGKCIKSLVKEKNWFEAIQGGLILVFANMFYISFAVVIMGFAFGFVKIK